MRTMKAQATAKFSVLCGATDNDAVSPPFPVADDAPPKATKKPFVNEASGGNTKDITERTVEISLRYGFRDTLMDSQHSLVPFLGDIDPMPNEKPNPNANKKNGDSQDSQTLQRLIRLWSDENLLSLPLEHGVFEQDEAFWKAFVLGLPSSHHWPCVNALYQIERRFPKLSQIACQLRNDDSVAANMKSMNDEEKVEISMTKEQPAVGADSALKHNRNDKMNENAPEKEAEPQISRELLVETSAERALAEQWMDASLCSLPIQNVAEMNMGEFMEYLSAARLSPDRLHAMNGLYGLEHIEADRYSALLRQVQQHSATVLPKADGDVESSPIEMTLAREPVEPGVDPVENDPVDKVVEPAAEPPDEQPTVSPNLATADGATGSSPIETTSAREPVMDEPAMVEEPEDQVVEPTAEPVAEPATETNHVIERALALLWMDPSLRSLPIQDVSTLDMGIFLDALSASRLSSQALQAMSGLYGLERIEPSRFSNLLRSVQQHSTTAVQNSSPSHKVSSTSTSSKQEVPDDASIPIATAVDEDGKQAKTIEEIVKTETLPEEVAVDDTPPQDAKIENSILEQSLPNETQPAAHTDDPVIPVAPAVEEDDQQARVNAENVATETLLKEVNILNNPIDDTLPQDAKIENSNFERSLPNGTQPEQKDNDPAMQIPAIVDDDDKKDRANAEIAATETLPKDVDTLTNPVDDTLPQDAKIENLTLEKSLPNETQPEQSCLDRELEDSPAQDTASFATSETAMSSMVEHRTNESAIPTSSTSSLKSNDSSIDIVPLKVAGNPSVAAPSYSEIIRKSASSDQGSFLERPTAATNTQRRPAVPVKKSQPKSRFVPSLSAVVSVKDSKPLVSSPKDQNQFDNSSVVVLMTSNPAHPEIAHQQKIVETTLNEEGCHNYLLIDGADRVQKWKRNSLFELSGSHGEYPQIFHRDTSGKLSFWGAFEAFIKAKKRGSLLDELMNRSITENIVEAEDEKTLLVLVSMQSFKQDVKVKQTKALSILDAQGISYETLDGADPVNKERRTQLFALSGSPGIYPQFFTIGPDQEVSHWGDWDDFESANELGSFAKEFGATKVDSLDRDQKTSQASLPLPSMDGSLVCLISGQSIERKVKTQQEKCFAIFDDRSIPYGIIDGAEKANKTLRKRLFGISGLNAVYPQFFLKKNDDYAYLGGWEKLEDCNEADNMGLFLTPVPKDPIAKDRLKTKSNSVKRSLSTQTTPKMENLSHGGNDAAAKTKTRATSKSEITFYGATSFVAKHALDYMIQVSLTLPGVRSITLAGRNAEKLERLRKTVADKMANMRTIHPGASGRCVFDVFVADSSDAAGLDAMASKTKVVASFAGPFAKYGEKVVAACAKVGTDYIDITGEVSWASAMRLKYSSLAEGSKARIISFCGFDSIPSDLAIYAAAETIKRKIGRSTDIASGTTWHYALGSANGGTIQTVVDMPLNISKCFSRWVPFLVEDPLALTHPKVRLDPDYSERKNRLAMSEWMNQLPQLEGFLRMGVSAPFFMAPVNSKVVQASAVALNYGTDFVYRERFLPLGFRMTKAMSVLSLLPALAFQFGVLLLGFVLKFPIIGKVLSRIFLPPGSGMSDQMCQKGASEIYAEVVTAETNGKVDRVYCAMKFEGDPGNWVTAQCVCESALSLVLDRAKLPKCSVDGFGTPAELLGSVLLERLEKTKVRPVDVKTYVQKSTLPKERVLCHFE